MLVSDPPAAEAALPSPDAEAARYALLRRLAPAMRHQLVVNLQPIGMIYEVMERRLRAPEPDLVLVQDSASRINGFARAALHSCLDVVGWLAPEPEATTTLHEGVREAVGLLATSLSFRGFVLRNETAALPGLLRRAAIRNLLPAALLHLTDHLASPAEVVLTATSRPSGIRVQLRTEGIAGEPGFAVESPYRKLEWDDLQALAAAEGAEIERQPHQATLFFPWADTP